MNKIQKKLINLLREDARRTDETLAVMLGVSVGEIAREIEQLESNGIINGYTAIINEEKLDCNDVTALIEIKVSPKSKFGYSDIASTIATFPEVESVRLMTGNFDLAVMIKCCDIKRIGRFVSEQLSPIEGVLSISTHFVIGRYKELGEIFDVNDERGLVSP